MLNVKHIRCRDATARERANKKSVIIIKCVEYGVYRSHSTQNAFKMLVAVAHHHFFLIMHVCATEKHQRKNKRAIANCKIFSHIE